MEPSHRRFRLLIEPIHDEVLGFARGLCRSRADGDDLFQDALLRALAKLHGLREDAAFRSWLYRVVVSVHRNRHRRSFWRWLSPLAGHEHANQRGVEDALGGAERARQALATLAPEQRETIVLFEIEGWQVDEIAALHGISISAVKSRLTRGRTRLRAFYLKYVGPLVTTPSSYVIPGGSP